MSGRDECKVTNPGMPVPRIQAGEGILGQRRVGDSLNDTTDQSGVDSVVQ